MNKKYYYITYTIDFGSGMTEKNYHDSVAIYPYWCVTDIHPLDWLQQRGPSICDANNLVINWWKEIPKIIFDNHKNKYE